MTSANRVRRRGEHATATTHASGRRGIICSPHYLATDVGLHVLQHGGNAVDACVAVNAMLQVTYPPMCGLGGDGFWMVYLARDKKLLGLNGSGRSPAAASADELRAAGYTSTPQRGPWSVTVPGCVDAWVEVRDRCGSRPLSELLAPAEKAAREGIPISARLAQWISDFASLYPADEHWRAIFSPGTRLPSQGDRLVQRDLAATYRAVIDGGREAFYESWPAQRMAQRVQQLGGWLTEEDLRRHHSEWVDPVLSAYRGVEIAEMPPNSQGTTAQLILNLVTAHGPLPRDGAERVDLILRATAIAYEERDRELADPVRMSAQADVLAQPATAERLLPRLARRARESAVALGGDTAYFCAVDSEGNCCSAIQSLYFGFGSGIVVPGTGILLQARGSFFSLQKGHRNELAPGVRTLHTLMPAMALRDGEPWLVFGTMGGNAQAQIHAQLLSSVIDDHLDPASAVAAPRWISGALPFGEDAPVTLEPGLADLAPRLRELGWKVQVLDYPDGFGHAHMIERRDGQLSGGADPRADSMAAAW